MLHVSLVPSLSKHVRRNYHFPGVSAQRPLVCRSRSTATCTHLHYTTLPLKPTNTTSTYFLHHGWHRYRQRLYSTTPCRPVCTSQDESRNQTYIRGITQTSNTCCSLTAHRLRQTIESRSAIPERHCERSQRMASGKCQQRSGQTESRQIVLRQHRRSPWTYLAAISERQERRSGPSH
jgi:hypothetical protein